MNVRNYKAEDFLQSQAVIVLILRFVVFNNNLNASFRGSNYNRLANIVPLDGGTEAWLMKLIFLI